MFRRPSSLRRLSRPAACWLVVALFVCCGVIPTAAAGDPKPDPVRKLEDQLRRATDRIDELLKEQNQNKEENARLREALTDARAALDLEKKKAAELSAEAKALLQDAKLQYAKALEKAIKGLDETREKEQIAKKELVAILNAVEDKLEAKSRELAEYQKKSVQETTQLKKALAEECKRADEQAVAWAETVKSLQRERDRAAATRQEAEAQRAAAEKNAKIALEAVARAKEQNDVERDRAEKLAALADAVQQRLKDREAQLEKRVQELEKAAERARPAPVKIGNMEGKVTAVASGLVKVNLGSEAGLTKGQTLEVYRLEPKPIYLGKITIIEVNAKDAVARPAGAKPDAINVGDQVTTQPPGK